MFINDNYSINSYKKLKYLIEIIYSSIIINIWNDKAYRFRKIWLSSII